MWIRNQRFQRLGGGVLERIGIGSISRLQYVFLNAHKDKSVVRLIKQVRRERRSLLTSFEAFLVYSLARAQSKQPGVMAEVGVYEGGSARLICDIKGDVPLHLFDTFEGLPKGSEADGKVHQENWYACSVESVQEYLKQFPAVYFHKGLFPASATEVPDQKYSFVHFDVDLYDSTRGCLEYFYSRMSVGGVMLSHDYSILAGVRQAFDEFLADRPEELIELPSTQCMVIKLPDVST